MMKQLPFGILFFLLGSIMLQAQVNRKTFPLSREFKKSGFYVSPLATISFGNKVEGNGSDDLFSYSYELVGRGTWNAGLELGWYKTFEGYQVGDYFDGAVSYRRFSGVNYANRTNLEGPSTITYPNLIETENKFRVQQITAAVRVIDIAFQQPKHFLTWGFGLNYNYLLSKSYQKEDATLVPGNQVFQEDHVAQAHVQVGYGFKVSKKLLFIPTIETPLITAYPTSDVNPAFTFFNVKYHPMIIGLKLMFLREDPVNCNAPVLKSIPTN